MSSLGRRQRNNSDAALQSVARKKHTAADPLVHHGRHFGRAICAFCNVKALLLNGLARIADHDDSEDVDPSDDESLTSSERCEARVFQALLKLCRGLEDRLLDSSEEEVGLIADLIQKGANASRADDTKGMKSNIIDWITPPRQSLSPPLNRRSKFDRGFNHERTGSLLCPTGLDWSLPSIKEQLKTGEMHVRGDQWPIFLYADSEYNPDNPWNGLLKNQLLVFAYKHVFTSPSSVDVDDDDDDPKISKAGNARIHGMDAVTTASLAYIATQVRFALSSANSFSRTDTITDSERFYHSLFDTLEDVQEQQEVSRLLAWWNKKIFPYTSPESVLAPVQGSALERIRQKRAEAMSYRLISGPSQ
ncbi:hypothetical protein Hypma_003884 [Hypsizygus marmoreus]|uniref:Uncharacterized protein n=1 Tax=Hypsizygus marmoreus TaxID=39966 RepID=A0A369K4K0_HYPMA|nr:hypothetical protein Hypma_003884 [Hypsizygus marmoreus]